MKTQNDVETKKLGKELGEFIRYNQKEIKTIHLQGDLGTGKTTISKGIMEGIGFNGLVKSPTFALVEIYETNNITIFHFDLYRLDSVKELLEIGIHDYLQQKNAISIFEWPENAGSIIPLPCIDIKLNHDKNHIDWRYIDIKFKEKLEKLRKLL
ncbi:MAG: tRNA (adenosine(37)-N6)-threonylcarbamoyltransferase complex ATPase subunit type 1 TsaE [SAR86 cluster bacterium]|nr:tRNA (adenosine(37)-N6)-threonylcarbamoyltransferase complex ATPase subunit type 1 TsaE [SAR86 cluster bacterium]